jgi:branched-chain amino acid transport system ATP-binding protein
LTSVLEVKEVSKSFGGLQALNGVSLAVEEKTVSILIGPNGSGKTTLINVVGGLYKPDSGTILFRGTNITGKPAHAISRAGLVRTFQIPSVFPKLTVLENMLIARKGNPGENFLFSLVPRRWLKSEGEAIEEASRVLEMVKLSEVWNKEAGTVSGGQLKLIEIGRALMSGANTVLLDEPISGVNPSLAHEIFDVILRLRDELGLTFFIVEHRLDIALKYVDFVHAMAYGKLIASGVPDLVMTNPELIEAYLGG